MVSALGPAHDPTSRAVASRLARAWIAHRPIVVPERNADWTLLVSSGRFGDKLPVGFRGCHSAVTTLSPWTDRPCALRVVAALPNPLAAEALRAPGDATRVFAPAMRNMIDRDVPVSRFAEWIDVLCCNRHEWESLADREEVGWRVGILAVTDGPRGSTVRFTNPLGEPASTFVPAFPRSAPPRDTNRAGEAFAATLVTTLLDGGWNAGVAEESLVERAASRASAAAALVLDRTEFGFPTPEQVDAALRAGRVDGSSDGAGAACR